MLIIAVLIMIVGFVGIFIPGLPGIGLIFISALGYGYLTGFEEISVMLISVFAVLTILAMILDYIGGILGAKRFGASKSGILWGMVGGIIGFLLFGLIGLLLGQFVGTMGGELLRGKKLELSLKSGIGSLIGYILSVVMNMSIGLFMIAIFLIRVLNK